MSVDWNLIAGITVTGLTVVFLALILLIFCMKIMGFVMVKIQSSKNKSDLKNYDETVESIPKPKTEYAGIDPETVAVIAAAVAAENPKEYPVSIRKISRAENFVSAWRQAGILQNTEAFERGGAK